MLDITRITVWWEIAQVAVERKEKKEMQGLFKQCSALKSCA